MEVIECFTERDGIKEIKEGESGNHMWFGSVGVSLAIRL